MQIKTVILAVMAIFFTSVQAANKLIDDQNLKLHGYLPDGWVFYTDDDSSRAITDTSSDEKHKALLYITRYSLDNESPQDWTRSFFIAQKFNYDYSVYSFYSVIYFDSSANSKHQSAWAPQIYSRCYSDDTTNMAWDEYVYFTAINGYGYEFVAIGDTSDMETNISYYMDILHGFVVDNGQSKSANFLLSDLQTDPQIQFTPAFSPSIGTYTATVGVDISKISFTCTTDQNNAVISVNNSTVVSAQRSASQNLSIGNNTIQINVTAQDGTSIKNYSFMINRLSTNIAVKRPLQRAQVTRDNNTLFFNLCGRKISTFNLMRVKPIVPGVYIYKNAAKATAEKKMIVK